MPITYASSLCAQRRHCHMYLPPAYAVIYSVCMPKGQARTWVAHTKKKVRFFCRPAVHNIS